MGQIRISDELKAKLEVKKSPGDSFTTYFEKMFSYFEVTGIDINSKVISPLIAIQEAEKKLSKNDERIVKILMKFRTDYFVKLNEFLEKGSVLTPTVNFEDAISESEAAEMLALNKSLSNKVKDLEHANEKLRVSKPTSGPAVGDIQKKCDVIKQKLNELNNQVMPNNLNTENIQVKKAHFQLFYRTTISELNDIIDM